MTDDLKDFLIENKVLLSTIKTGNPECQELFDNWAEYNTFPSAIRRGNREEYDLLCLLLSSGITLEAILSKMKTIPATMFSHIYPGKLDLVKGSRGLFSRINENGFKSYWGSSGLTGIILPNSLESIGQSAFDGCDQLNEITFNEGLKIIEQDAFRYCKGLTEVYLPDSLEEIDFGAFGFCENLVKVSIPKKFKDQLTDIFFDNLTGSITKGYTPKLKRKLDVELR